MNIAPAKREDLPGILELQRACYRESAERYGDYTIPPLMQSLADLQRESETTLVLKAFDARGIIGSIRAFERDGTCHIGRVIVHPESQNRGIGKQLMREMERRFASVRRYELFTGFRDAKNLHFYQSLGYRPFRQERVTDELTFVFLEKRPAV